MQVACTTFGDRLPCETFGYLYLSIVVGKPYRDPMALEREAELGGPVGIDGLEAAGGLLLLGGLFAEVLDADSTLDGSHGKTLLVRENRHTPGQDSGKNTLVYSSRLGTKVGI